MVNFNSGFEEQDVRRKFVTKVYSLLLIQLLVCVTIIFVCIFVEPVKEFLRHDWIVLITCGVLGLLFYLALTCVPAVRLKVPANYIVLTLMTLFLGVVLGVLSARMKTLIVIASLAITVTLVVFLTLLSMIPCFDITGWIIYVVVITTIISLVGLVILILALVFKMRVLFMVYAGLLAVVYSIFIVFDTQLIMGGKKHELSPEEYILGTVMLFTDIIGLYMMILTVMQGAAN